MIQRSILRQSRQVVPRTSQLRAASSQASFTSVQRSRASSSLFGSPLAQPRHLSSTFPAPTRAKILSRWYSQDAAKPAQESDESLGQGAKGEEPTVEGGEAAAENSLQKDLDAKSKEIVDLKDKYLRQVAEFRNLQERTKREVQQAKDFAIQRFAKDLVESVDNFDLALSTVPAEKLAERADSASAETEDPNKDLKQLFNGLKMTETVLMNTLKKHGLERFDPSENGDKFDPNVHEATFQTPQPDKQDGTVFYTTQKGFMLNGRVLRAAKVGVVKNS